LFSTPKNLSAMLVLERFFDIPKGPDLAVGAFVYPVKLRN